MNLEQAAFPRDPANVQAFRVFGVPCEDCWDVIGKNRENRVSQQLSCYCGTTFRQDGQTQEAIKYMNAGPGAQFPGKRLIGYVFKGWAWDRRKILKWIAAHDVRVPALIEKDEATYLPQFPRCRAEDYALIQIAKGLVAVLASVPEEDQVRDATRAELLPSTGAHVCKVTWLGNPATGEEGEIAYTVKGDEVTFEGESDESETEKTIPLPDSGECPTAWPVRVGNRCLTQTEAQARLDRAMALAGVVKVQGTLRMGVDHDHHEIDVVCKNGEIDVVSKTMEEHEHLLSFTAVREGRYRVECSSEESHPWTRRKHRHVFEGSVYLIGATE